MEVRVESLHLGFHKVQGYNQWAEPEMILDVKNEVELRELLWEYDEGGSPKGEVGEEVLGRD